MVKHLAKFCIYELQNHSNNQFAVFDHQFKYLISLVKFHGSTEKWVF